MNSKNALAFLEIGAAMVAGYFIYKTVKAAGDGVAAVKDTAKEVITKDLNPASPENVIYSNLPDSVKLSIQKGLDVVLGDPTVRDESTFMERYTKWVKDFWSGDSSKPSNVTEQAIPSTGGAHRGPARPALPNQSNAETARLLFKNSEAEAQKNADNLYAENLNPSGYFNSNP